MVTKRLYAQLAIYIAFALGLLVSSFTFISLLVKYIIQGVLAILGGGTYLFLRFNKKKNSAYTLLLITGCLFPFLPMLIMLTDGLDYHLTSVFAFLLFIINIFLEEKSKKTNFENLILLLFALILFMMACLVGLVFGFINTPISGISIASYVIYTLIILSLSGILGYYFIQFILKQKEELKKDNSKNLKDKSTKNKE